MLTVLMQYANLISILASHTDFWGFTAEPGSVVHAYQTEVVGAYYDLQNQKAVTASLESKQLLPFGFCRHYYDWWGPVLAL